MRQFLLCKGACVNNTLETLGNNIAFYSMLNGKMSPVENATHFNNEGYIALGRPDNEGGPIVLPFYNNDFSYSKGVYQAATKFSANLTIPAPTTIGSYSIIIAKKGVQFNERNKWTATVYVRDMNTTAAQLAEKLVEQINNNSAGSGVKATLDTATITIEAVKAGVDYTVLTADDLMGTAVTITANGLSAYGDAEYVKDLAMKAAADAGFEYTYRDAAVDLYPNFPLNPLAQANVEDSGFVIFTLRFAEPRKVKTRDEVVHQIIQVAFVNTGVATASTGEVQPGDFTLFETICKQLAGEE